MDSWFIIDNLYKKLVETKNIGELENRFANIDINNADYVITKSGKLIDMKRAKAILGDAMDQLVTTIDPMLSTYFNAMRVNYTFKIDTFAVDGKILYINPAFLINAFEMPAPFGDVKMIAYVLLHECFHLLFDHCDDKEGIRISGLSKYDADLVNMAMDYQINWVIEHSTFDLDDDGALDYMFAGYTKQLDGCIDDRFKLMDWPEIYKILKQEGTKVKSGINIKQSKNPPKKMSKEWYDGFMKGLNKKLDELKKNKLIESNCKIYI